jgi:hypothetical protein
MEWATPGPLFKLNFNFDGWIKPLNLQKVARAPYHLPSVKGGHPLTLISPDGKMDAICCLTDN